jgi:hypothetical protein
MFSLSLLVDFYRQLLPTATTTLRWLEIGNLSAFGLIKTGCETLNSTQLEAK